MDTEKYLDISFNEFMLGYPLPDSHFEIAVLETNNAEARHGKGFEGLLKRYFG